MQRCNTKQRHGLQISATILGRNLVWPFLKFSFVFKPFWLSLQLNRSVWGQWAAKGEPLWSRRVEEAVHVGTYLTFFIERAAGKQNHKVSTRSKGRLRCTEENAVIRFNARKINTLTWFVLLRALQRPSISNENEDTNELYFTESAALLESLGQARRVVRQDRF